MATIENSLKKKILQTQDKYKVNEDEKMTIKKINKQITKDETAMSDTNKNVNSNMKLKTRKPDGFDTIYW